MAIVYFRAGRLIICFSGVDKFSLFLNESMLLISSISVMCWGGPDFVFLLRGLGGGEILVITFRFFSLNTRDTRLLFELGSLLDEIFETTRLLPFGAPKLAFLFDIDIVSATIIKGF